MLIRICRWVATSLVFFFAFVVNPAYVAGCSSDDDDKDPARLAQIEADLTDQLEGLNEVHTWEVEVDDVHYEIDVELQRAKKTASNSNTESALAPEGMHLMSVAHACGNHTFYQSASACFTVYSLAVEGKLSLRRTGPDAAEILTDVAISGLINDYGPVELTFGSNHVSLANPDTTDMLYEVDYIEAKDLGTEKLDLMFTRN